jgi:hypothetical protein
MQGPLSVPIIDPQGAQYSRFITELVGALRSTFILPVLDGFPFIVVGSDIEMTAAGQYDICTLTLADGFSGIVTHIGARVDPPENFKDVPFDILSNGQPVPNMSNLIFGSNTLSTPLPFPFAVSKGKKITLRATNNAGKKLWASGILLGRQTSMSDVNSWGFNRTGI